MPVAHNGEWRPKQRAASKQNNNSRRRGEFRKNNIELFFNFIYIYNIHIIEYVLTLLNSVFKGSRADVGADVGLVPGGRGCGRGFLFWVR